MSVTSQLNEAEDALLAALVARAATPGSALAGLPITLGDPVSKMQREHVFIPDAAVDVAQEWDITRQSFAPASTGPRHETFSLEVVVFTSHAGDAFTPLRDRGSALSEEVEQAVLADQTLGGAVGEAHVAKIHRATGPYEDRRGMEITITVEADVWLT